MKQLKKVCALVLALCMCLSVSTTAFAASSDDTDFSITISNSNNGSTYDAYKIFDVTYDGNGNYSYTLTDTATTTGEGNEAVTAHSNPWYELIVGPIGEGADVLTSPFTLTASTGAAADGAVIYVVTVEDITDEEIIAYLNAAIAQLATYDEEKGWSTDLTVDGTANGNGGTMTITLSEPGYYFVTTTTGSIVSITTTDPTATIIDKQTPPPDIEKVIVHEDGAKDALAEADGMGEEVSFDVIATVPITETIDGEDGTQTYNYVTDYTITDSMTNGLLIELRESEFRYDESTGKYYLTNDMINSWITLTNGTGNELSSFTDYVYDYSFELIGYDVYTDEITGEDVHTFSGFVLTYYTYNVDLYKTNLKLALEEAGYDLNGIWPDGQEWPTASEIDDSFDFDSEAYFEEYSATNTVGTKYPANASLEIAYTAHVTSLEGYENTNEIYLDHHVTPFSHPVPYSPEPGPQKFARDYVYSWELQIVKINGEDKVTPLEGATFTLYSENMKNVKVGHSYLYVPISLFEDGVYTDEDGNTYNFDDFESTHYVKSGDSYIVGEDVSEYDTYVRILTSDASVEDITTTHSVMATTDENGKIYFEGLGTGVYILTEITAPDGYNLLDDPIIFQITFKETGDETTGYEGVFTVTYGSLNGDGDFTANQSDYGTNLIDKYILVETIENESGTLLPGTGGIGTTVFYVAGICLMLGAAVVLITRRRMRAAD